MLTSLRSLLALSSMVLAPAATANALDAIGDLHFEPVEGSDTLADGVVTALAQDHAGFIWIGTQQGLFRFDGYRLLAFQHDPNDDRSLGADFVRDIVPSADGSLWVATATGGVSRLDAATGRFTRFRHDPDNPNSLGHDGVLSLAPADDQARSVWLALAGAGVDRFDPDSGRFMHHRSEPGSSQTVRHDTVRSLLRDRRGNLWIGTRRGLSRRLPDGRFETQAAGIPDFEDQYVYALFESSDGRIWVGTQGMGAGWIDPESGRWHPLPLGVETEGLAHPWVTGFAEPVPGRIWIATYGSGIDVLDPKSGKIGRRIRRDASVSSSLALDSVTTLMRDASGLIWVGSWGGGLQRYNPQSAFHTLHHSPSRPDSLSDPSVYGVLGRRDGTIWVGTESRGIDVLDRTRGVIGGFRHDPAVAGSLPAGAIPALIESEDGTVWIGTRQAGLHRFDAASQRFVPAQGVSGSSDTRISGMIESPRGDLLIQVESGLVEFDTTAGTSRAMRMADGTAFALPVRALTAEPDGRLWVATARGLLQRSPGGEGLQWVKDSEPGPSIVNSAIKAMVMGADGTLYVSGLGALWFAQAPRAEMPRFQRLELDDATRVQVDANELVSDRQGRLWSRGLMVDPSQRRAWTFGRAEGADVGAPTEGMPGKSLDGLLLFGGTRGLLIVDTGSFAPWRYEPAVVISQLSVDGRAQTWAAPGSGLMLPDSAHRFSVEFAALDFSEPSRNRYRYRLVGVDEDWIETDAGHRVATYSKLWPGRYELRLSASNRSGIWSPHQVTLPIEVMPAFWQTTWFLLVLLALLAAVVYLGVVVRTARIRRQSRELARLVEIRTDELSTAHRALLETQHKLAVQERVAALGGLVAGVAHEVSTPLGVVMTALSGIADVWKRLAMHVRADAPPTELDPLLADGAEYTELALRNSDRVGELVTNLKAIVARRDSDQVETLDMPVYLREAAALVGSELRERDCRIEVTVAEGLTLATVPDALTEVLGRVLRNTLDHAFPDRRGGVVRISASTSGDGVEIVVVDDGAGIDAEALGQVFDPFFTTRRGRDGFVGLGLYIAYTQVTQRLKGGIKVVSTPGNGAEVRLQLPNLTVVTSAASG